MSDIDLLNASLAGEYFGVAAYEAAIGSGLDATDRRHRTRSFQVRPPSARGPARSSRSSCTAVSASSRWRLMCTQLSTRHRPAGERSRTTMDVEAGAAATDVAWIGSYDEGALAIVIAQIAAVEAQHWSALLAATGQPAVPAAFIPLPEA